MRIFFPYSVFASMMTSVTCLCSNHLICYSDNFPVTTVICRIKVFLVFFFNAKYLEDGCSFKSSGSVTRASTRIPYVVPV